MRRRGSMRRKTRFKNPKNSFKNNKSIYIIIALICMIGLNIVYMTITLSKNIKASISIQNEDFSQENNLDKVGILLKEIFNKKDKKQAKEDVETGYETVEDFIIIDNLEEYENFIVVRDPSGEINLEDIPEPVNIKKIKVDKTRPYILAFHTHANEGYQPLKKPINYTSDNNQNVTSIGDIFSKVLENGSHKIIHNKTHHDVPSFNKSYSRSLNTIKTEMAKEGNLKFLFDIHRDGVQIKANTDKEYFEKIKKNAEKFSTTIDGKDVATFSLVVGPDSANFKENLSYAKYIKAVSDAVYPGLCKGIIIKKVGRFNQYLSDYSALIEVGANVNTIDQSKETAKLIGEILNIVISKLIL
ncbi:stage II sporulation protein P [Tissierella creatinophila]|uniref:Stage II sporulation protein SpoIIP n=1 Tax=Tissierella creatinophila DSM 6911 TaxID=1123403 RepID=A0A1U7M7T2_TISCR|nr:stage II sporulation protein P [Tissierella creatinophila]OLS03394.1 stage II sporulation protein SpoIIP [Tissierella creatinophila DSM 6911]